MCGIAGAIVYDSGSARLDCLLAAVEASSSRGEDAFGIVRWSASAGFRFHRLLGRSQGGWLDAVGPPAADEPTVYLHTSRAEPTTEWRQEKTDTDIPPFVDEGIAVAHNGIIANDDDLAENYGLDRVSSIDTAIVPPLVARLGLWAAVAALKGGAALAIFDERRMVLALCRNFMPLVLAWEPGIVCFASEAGFFPEARRPFRTYQSWELPPYSGLELAGRGYRGPVTWGEQPQWKDEEAWQPFPNLQWGG